MGGDRVPGPHRPGTRVPKGRPLRRPEELNRSVFEVALRDLVRSRRRHLTRGGGPFEYRQALITVLTLDREAAIERGVKIGDLDSFDAGAVKEAEEWLRTRSGR